ncbi:hypothetical protein BDM02DRAFT_835935 [Thelephora ganbajun]|uniref:Uncharacterized protein n=1 Tax=Thelephora ganbajun TaxID=370292 RepID=A0ACB6Z674_THEGA|nr:hypothetical protein BDM02DRAFT_835935 [Thelephora ganbajun]
MDPPRPVSHNFWPLTKTTNWSQLYTIAACSRFTPLGTYSGDLDAFMSLSGSPARSLSPPARCCHHRVCPCRAVSL